jgi:hypothetical protein
MELLVGVTKVHCSKNFPIFRDAADQTLPVTEFSEIYHLKIKFSYLSRNIQLQVTFGLLHLEKSGSFRHSVCTKYGFSSYRCCVDAGFPSCYPVGWNKSVLPTGIRLAENYCLCHCTFHKKYLICLYEPSIINFPVINGGRKNLQSRNLVHIRP